MGLNNNLGKLTEILTVSGSNVGVGSTSPISILQAAGTITVGTSTNPSSVGVMQLTTGGVSPISNRLTYGTDGTGWKFAIGKNQGGTVTDQLVVQTDGSVGIGLTNPSEKLEVSGSIKAHSLTTGLTSYDTNGLTIRNAADTSNLWSINKGAGDGSENWQFYNFGRSSIDFSVNNSTGNVGIGNTSPQAPLSFAKSIGNKIDFYYDTTGGGDRYGIQVQSGELRIHSGAAGVSTGGITFGKHSTSTFTESMRIHNSGTINFTNSRIKFIGGTNYNENIRMSVGSNGYSSLIFAADPNSDVGAIAGQWSLVRWPDASSNKFTIRHNSDDHLHISTAGHITTPNQPAFSAFGPAGGFSTTSTGAFTLFSQTRTNRGGWYNASNGRFTAPVAGVYDITFSLLWRQASQGGAGEISIGVNGANISSRGIAYSVAGASNEFHDQMVVKALLTLNAGDYVTGWIHSNAGNFYYGEGLGYFTGHLIG